MNWKCVVISTIFLLMLVETAYAYTLTVNTTNATDGGLYTSLHNTTFTLIRNSGAGVTNFSGFTSTIQSTQMGADLDVNSFYRNYRGVLRFDTSPLPDGAVVTGATLYLFRNAKSSALGDMGINLIKYIGSDSFLTTDYVNFDFTPFNDSYVNISPMPSGYITFVLNSAGIQNISKTGNTTFGVATQYDILNTAPGWVSGANSFFEYKVAESVTYPPSLVITYDSAVETYPLNSINDTKILPQSDTTLPPQGTNISINATPGEYEWASFVIKPLATTDDISIKATSLTDGAHTISAGNIDIKLIKVWHQDGSSVHNATPQAYTLTPELLLNNDSILNINYTNQTNELWIKNATFEGYYPIDNRTIGAFPSDAKVFDNSSNGFPQNFSLPANWNKQVFLTIHIPNDQDEGNYTGKIWINSSASLPKAVNLSVRVLPFELENSTIRYGVFYTLDYTPGGTTFTSSDRNPEMIKADLWNLKNHSVLYPTWYQNRNSVSDIQNYLADRNTVGFPMDRLMTYGWCSAYTCSAWSFIGNPSDSVNLSIAGTKVNNTLLYTSAAGYLETWFYAIDEGNAATLASERPAFGVIHINNSGKVWATGHDYNLATVADVLDAGVNAYSYNTTARDIFIAEGHDIGLYQNPQSAPETPETYRKNYGLGLLNASYNMTMVFSYQQQYGNSVWNDYDDEDDTRYRDTCLAYPTTTNPINTLQFEGFREGITDTRYAITLTHINGNATQSTTIIQNGLSAGVDMSVIRGNLIKAILDAIDDPPVASFTANVTTGITPLSVNFTDTSTNLPSSWNWSFRNVTGNNTEVWWTTTQNPVKVFPIGNWSIKLNASNSYGYNLSAQKTFINVTGAAPVSSFTANVTSGVAPLVVSLTDTSSNSPTSWSWAYKNATVGWTFILTNQNIAVTLPEGVYSINLTATNAYGSDDEIKVNYITVTNSSTPAIPYSIGSMQSLWSSFLLMASIPIVIGGIVIASALGNKSGNNSLIFWGIGIAVIGTIIVLITFMLASQLAAVAGS